MRSKECNKATLFKHIWDIGQKSNTSLWIDWIYAYKLNKKTLWESGNTRESSWNWKKILKMRDFIRNKMKCVISNGNHTPLLKDN